MKDRTAKIIWLLSFVSVCTGVILIIFFPEERAFVMAFGKDALNNEGVYFSILGVSLVTGLFYSLYFAVYKPKTALPSLLKLFGPLIDPIANALSLGAVICSSIRMMRGLYCQYFYDEIYFKEFGIFDITSIALCSLVLLIWGSIHLYKYASFFFVQGSSTTKVEPYTED